jgi:hypothetical protein
MGGKPSRGTKADKRLASNRPKGGGTGKRGASSSTPRPRPGPKK